MKINKILIKMTAVIFRSLARASQFMARKLSILKTPVYYSGKGIFSVLIFPFYKFLYFVKYKSLNLSAPARSRVFFILNKSYLIHLVVGVIAFFVVVNNIGAAELRQENFGERTIIYSLVSGEEFEELTEETHSALSGDTILSYLDRTTAVESQRAIVENTETDDRLATELSTVTQGGAAIVKPNIIQPVDIDRVPSQATQQRNELTTYTVLPGETVSAIARKFNVSVETILWQNNLGTRSIIRPGNTLEILPVSGITHKVTRGQTVSAIARKYDISADEIISFNNLFNASDIQIGQHLIIPGGKKASPYLSQQYAYGSTPQVSPITKLFVPPSQRVSVSGMVWPTSVRRISQYYSWRHRAIDIAGPVGSPIYASEAGTVELSGWTRGYGYNIIINHGNGIKTRYAHHSKLYVERGDAVVKGQTIAAMGSTGWSTGSHIHFEVIVSGVKKNPLSYVK